MPPAKRKVAGKLNVASASQVKSALTRARVVDNSWVIPHNRFFTLKYDCHINVEVCISVESVKYLCKYVYKGPAPAKSQVLS